MKMRSLFAEMNCTFACHIIIPWTTCFYKSKKLSHKSDIPWDIKRMHKISWEDNREKVEDRIDAAT